MKKQTGLAKCICGIEDILEKGKTRWPEYIFNIKQEKLEQAERLCNSEINKLAVLKNTGDLHPCPFFISFGNSCYCLNQENITLYELQNQYGDGI